MASNGTSRTSMRWRILLPLVSEEGAKVLNKQLMAES
jgi:hypothetical protein